VILASAISSNLAATASLPSSHAGSGGLGELQHLPAGAHALVVKPLADAFGTTFVWAFVLILVAMIPAVGMALSGRRARVQATAVADRELVGASS
jgi:hypothetical protein